MQVCVLTLTVQQNNSSQPQRQYTQANAQELVFLILRSLTSFLSVVVLRFPSALHKTGKSKLLDVGVVSVLWFC